VFGKQLPRRNGPALVETATRNAILQAGTDTANSVGGAIAMNNQEYARRGMAEWHRQRDEYYAQREQWQQRPFQQDEAEARRGAVSPLGGVAKRSK
jgi:hypothetical protein